MGQKCVRKPLCVSPGCAQAPVRGQTPLPGDGAGSQQVPFHHLPFHGAGCHRTHKSIPGYQKAAARACSPRPDQRPPEDTPAPGLTSALHVGVSPEELLALAAGAASKAGHTLTLPRELRPENTAWSAGPVAAGQSTVAVSVAG